MEAVEVFVLSIIAIVGLALLIGMSWAGKSRKKIGYYFSCFVLTLIAVALFFDRISN